MHADITIDPRFTGPPDVTNGGYACATVARAVDAVAEVTLRRPVPVATPLVLAGDGDRAVLSTREHQPLAEGLAVGALDISPPAIVSSAEAADAMGRYPALHWGDRMFPCFVCGPDRPDSLGVFPGPVANRRVVASVWRPDGELATASGAMPDEVSWGVLDCTGTWAAMIRHDLQIGALLGRMTAQVHTPPAPGRTYVAVGWAFPRDGRKLPAHAAILADDGTTVAVARLLCIEPRAE